LSAVYAVQAALFCLPWSKQHGLIENQKSEIRRQKGIALTQGSRDKRMKDEQQCFAVVAIFAVVARASCSFVCFVDQNHGI